MNEVGFSFTALRTVRGSFTVEATYEPVSPQRVAISFSRATLVPEQLQKLFQVRGWRCLHRECALAACPVLASAEVDARTVQAAIELSARALPRPTMSCCCPSSTQRAGSTRRMWMTGIALAATTRATPLYWSDADAATCLGQTIMLRVGMQRSPGAA